ncbi:MAG TPA: peptidase M23 [Gammaproteobacteria bacterium]|nr:peptidase M23 [Gammaproteobacteria bacterium]
MIRTTTPTFGKDLRYLSRRPSSGRSRVFGHPSHWVATFFIAVAVGIWLGSAPDAAVERSSITLKKQIELVLEQDPVPPSVTPAKEQVESDIDIASMPTMESFQGVAAIKENTPDFGVSLASFDTADTTDLSVKPQPVSAAINTDVADPQDASSTRLEAAVEPEHEKELPENSASVLDSAHWESIQIRSGDSLVGIFKRLALDVAQAIEISKLPKAKPLISLRTGPYLKIQRDGRDLVALRYQPNIKTFLQVTAENHAFVTEIIEREFELQEREVTVEVTDSLYQSALRRGLPESVIYRVSEIFQWELDFGRDVKRGDRLTVIYEERSLDARKVGNGPILAVRFENDGVLREAIRYVDSEGTAAYYTPEGKSLQRAFLRTPVPGRHVTSGFSYNRLHPILKVRRPHLGVDYGAPRGTPIVATADGKVIRASRKGGYGKTVILRHGQNYRTLYAHLSRYAKGLRKGKWVKKGQVIGYVGSTGLSTGPHLHYEIHVDGKARNPLSLKLPRAAPIGKADKANYLKHARLWSSRLNEARSAT